MYKILDMEKWSRKDHFSFFSKFEEPFFGITAQVNCSKAYDLCKENGFSFFLYYLHASLFAANKIENFRFRIQGQDVIIYDRINASPTINREDGTFGFSYMDFYEDFEKFQKEAKKEIERVRNTTGLIPAMKGENVIHFSAVPWINFSSISHARSFSFPDSCPKISFGKVIESVGNKHMSVSVHVHHALMDGYHVGKFLEELQNLLNR
ncbi:CatA-like O-acetyltransferase [Shivajiella indica]|uniref:CatA-like O-acetyltransferase n=1 Tax=Shivajiella indica TaxID=872115 RepID=A0ABW5B766_9BACT